MKNRVNAINIQMFANFEDIVVEHKDAFGDTNLGESFTQLSTKLSELGYDVLINNRKQAEFVPAGRLHEVSGQRDQFKTQVEALNAQLEQMKTAAQGNASLQAELQELMDKNTQLLKDLEAEKINTNLILEASDAIDPKDVLKFVDYTKITVDKKTGEVKGVSEEIARLRQEKQYLFGSKPAKRGGSDPGSDKGEQNQVGMNAMIRRAAGRMG